MYHKAEVEKHLMKIDIKVSNLGRLNEGDIKIRPITLLTGPNGTGKSFLTKSLYSILNAINTNVYHLDLTKKINLCVLLLDSLKAGLSYPAQNDYEKIEHIHSYLADIQLRLNSAAEELELKDYLDYTKSNSDDIDEVTDYFTKYLESLSKKTTKKASIESQSVRLNDSLNILKLALANGLDNYTSALQTRLADELKENFQVADLSQLVSFNESDARIDIDDLVYVGFGKSGISFSLQHDFINKISSLSSVVFFESPAYWKVRDALKAVKEQSEFPFRRRAKANRKLTGVPKYFYDLDNTLNEQVKNSEFSEIDDLASIIEKELGGEFVFSGDELVFKDNISNKEVSKNLISFGMTNLGMIHALLKNNVITPGSFVFIDEPETNLHPSWQVLLMDILIKLAEKDVNIVIATHSIDMLKALEVGLKRIENISKDDFMSIHYFDTDGTLMEFDSDDSSKQLIEARNELSSPYETLFFSK